MVLQKANGKDKAEDAEKSDKTSAAAATLRWSNLALSDFRIIHEAHSESGLKTLLAEHKYTGELYNVRQLKWDKNEQEQVTNEVRVLGYLKDYERVIRGCLPFKDYGQAYLATQYMSGGNLRTLLNNIGSLKEEIIKLYLAQIVIILHNIHECSVIYCNLRPESVYFDENVIFHWLQY